MSLSILLIISFFSLLQSLFGIGLLLFGTPTLLLLNVPFNEALSILLPSSITISLIQFIQNKEKDLSFIKNIIIYCLPMICIFLVINMLSSKKIIILEPVIAIILLLTAIFRVSSRIFLIVQKKLIQYSTSYLILMGAIHGYSNMGGSFLSIYASTIHKNKQAILACISSGYLLFGLIQILTLSIIEEIVLTRNTFLYCLVSGTIYLLLGNKLFSCLSEKIYSTLFTSFIFCYSFLLFWSYFVR